MPLIVKDYVWEETDKNVFITVPLKGVKAGKVDILSSEEYLKVWLMIIMIMSDHYVIISQQGASSIKT
jgi:hypothetical protein